MKVMIIKTRSPYYWYKKRDIGKIFEVLPERKRKSNGLYCYVVKGGMRFIDCRDCKTIKPEATP